jgi:D-sedoheptulose 7-phosphate isomerase
MLDSATISIRGYLGRLQDTLTALSDEQIQAVIDLLYQARLKGRQVFIMGNGGSASTASHFVCDLGKNTRQEGLPHFRVIGLTDNMALFSAFANDEGYDQVFRQQLESLVQPDDVVIGISTSGKSPNVVNAIRRAGELGAVTVGFTGYDGGHLRQYLDFEIHVASSFIEQIEDVHLVLEHLIVANLRSRFSQQA